MQEALNHLGSSVCFAKGHSNTAIHSAGKQKICANLQMEQKMKATRVILTSSNVAGQIHANNVAMDEERPEKRSKFFEIRTRMSAKCI